jgi:hypothetical protein
MLARGDRKHDIAAYFGQNPARVVDISKERKFADVAMALEADLPPPGPYIPPRLKN